MNDLIKKALGQVFTPPPIPPEAFPVGNRIVPGAHATLELAWQTLFYQTLTTGISIGALGVIAVIVGVILRQSMTKAIAEHLKGLSNQ